MRSYKVAILLNTKEHAIKVKGAPQDAKAELDSDQIALDFAESIESFGHRAFIQEGNIDLPKWLAKVKPDICFNTCEGFIGESREAQVPTLLEMLQIPYTGPSPIGATITQDKPLTKMVLDFNNILTPNFQVFEHANDTLNKTMTYPLFIKPTHEGSGKGIKSDSIAYDDKQLQTKVQNILSLYKQPALVEEYIEGRDFTCGLVGNTENDLHIFPVSEIDLTQSKRGFAPIYGIDQKFNYVDEYKGICPARISAKQTQHIQEVTYKTFKVTQGRDYARVDFRMDKNGNIYVIEINGLPGVSMVSDLSLTAYAEGWSYKDFVEAILEAGLRRYKML